ncbi:MAG: Carboxypeptidase, partial [Chlorobi bacterium]|nr:Carboxypeptidase [Chlorobiota bacterium]
MAITTRCIVTGIIALIAISLASRRAAAQLSLDDNGSGTTYILAFPDTTANKLDSRFPNNKIKEGFSLCLYSAVGPNKVRIITNSGATNIVTLAAGKFLSYDVKTSPVVTVSNAVQYNTIRLEAEKP